MLSSPSPEPESCKPGITLAFSLRLLAYSLARARLFALISAILAPVPIIPAPLPRAPIPAEALTPPAELLTRRPEEDVPIEERVRGLLRTTGPRPYCCSPAVEDPLPPSVACVEEVAYVEEAARCAPSFAITFEREMRGLRWILGPRCTAFEFEFWCAVLVDSGMRVGDDGWPVIGFTPGIVGATSGVLKMLVFFSFSTVGDIALAYSDFFRGERGSMTGIFEGEALLGDIS